MAQYVKKEYLKLHNFSFEIRLAHLHECGETSADLAANFKLTNQKGRARRLSQLNAGCCCFWTYLLLKTHDWQSGVIIKEIVFLNVPFVEDKWPQKTNFPSFTEVEPGIVIQI